MSPLQKIRPATFNDPQADFCPNFVERSSFYAVNLDQPRRFDDADNAEGQNLAAHQEDGEINPHLVLHANRLQGGEAGG